MLLHKDKSPENCKIQICMILFHTQLAESDEFWEWLVTTLGARLNGLNRILSLVHHFSGGTLCLAPRRATACGDLECIMFPVNRTKKWCTLHINVVKHLMAITCTMTINYNTTVEANTLFCAIFNVWITQLINVESNFYYWYW